MMQLYPILVVAIALANVAKRRYEPGKIEGRTIEVVSTIRITFSLR